MTSIERKFTLQVPSSTENLAMIRDFVSKISVMAGFDESTAAQIELAVDEACANVIEHAYGEDVTREVSVRARVDEDQVQIDIIDTGKGFDPTAVAAKNVEQLIAERKSGGLGMQLISRLMDDVHYEIKPGERNELHMIKKRKKG